MTNILSTPFDFTRRRALVCGASQGIGEATAQLLAHGGAEIILVARSSQKLKEVSSQLPVHHGQNHMILPMDLNQTTQIQEGLTEALSRGPIDIVVNNAGGPKAGPLMDAHEEEFVQAFQAHILAASFIAKKVLPGMMERKYGRVVNIISTSVKTPIPNLGVSNTIRGAMASWAKSLANEVAPFGITVNNVLPGYTETPRLEALAQANAQKQNKTPEAIKSQWIQATPAGRFASPFEVAYAVGFLASPGAGYITGVNLPVEGGRIPCR